MLPTNMARRVLLRASEHLSRRSWALLASWYAHRQLVFVLEGRCAIIAMFNKLVPAATCSAA